MCVFLFFFVFLQEIPKDIDQDCYKAIFYQVQRTSDVYMFESSLHESHYLGFEHDSSGGYDKLVLHHNPDEVDARLDITLEDDCVNATA